MAEANHLVSVCMATYNGGLYLEAQINSILEQLGQLDEFIIVDDCSTDNTISIINSYHDARIKLYINESNQGHVKTFQRALQLATNETILLSDQDDVWVAGRLAYLVSALLNSECDLVSSNYSLIDSRGNKIPDPFYVLKESDSGAVVSNLVGIFFGTRPYCGCTMAFRKNLLRFALPMPKYVESHDLWLALVGNLTHSNLHVEMKTIMRRLHFTNVTPRKRRPLLRIMITRIGFILSIFIILCRCFGIVGQKTSSDV